MAQDWFAQFEIAPRRPAAASPTSSSLPPNEEKRFKSWYGGMAKRYNLNPDPDDPAQFYDYRGAFKANARPGVDGHWPSQFKQPGHPNEVVGGFNTRTGARVAGTKRATEAELVDLGWEPATAKSLAAKAETRYLSTDTPAGDLAPTFRAENERDPQGRPVVAGERSAPADDWFDQFDTPVESRQPARAEDFMPPQEDRGSATGRFVSNLWEKVNPVAIASGLYDAVRHPIDTAKGIVHAHADQLRQAREAFSERRYIEAGGHTGAGLLPVFGPMAGAAGEQMAEGDVAGGLGSALGILAGPAAAKGSVNVVRAGARAGRAAVAGHLTPPAEQAAAVKWALDQGVPVDPATATGSSAVRRVRSIADSSLGGNVAADRAAKLRAASMENLGRNLAGQAAPAAATAESAGAAIRGGVEAAIRKAATNADVAYGRVRSAGDPMVNLAPAKAALTPIYDALMRKRELTGQLMGAEGRAAVALDSLVGGADRAPLSVVDAALGDLKALARGAEMPELRSVGQGLAAEAVRNLESAVQTTAKAAGVWDDLRAGRDATIAKWGASDVRDLLRAEPVQTFRMLTQAGDAAIDRLRDVRRVAPGELPKVGRAYLDGLIETATAEGGFGRGAKLWADWAKLGDETKALLYPEKALRTELDHFFLVGKKLAEDVNPSGSTKLIVPVLQGSTAAAGGPLAVAGSVISGYALSRMLNSPATARLLTKGMQTASSAPAARSLSARLRFAIRAAVPVAQQTGAASESGQRQPRGTP